MKKSLKRVIASTMAVVTLSMGITGISANAWGLYNNPGGPSSAQSHDDYAGFFTSVERSTLNEKCTYYSSNTQPNGSVAYAKYKPFAITYSGKRVDICSSDHYHYQVNSGPQTIQLNQAAPANSTIYGDYHLMNYSGIYCSIYGYIN